MSATASMLMDRLGADGISVFQSNGAAAGQEVGHLHFHVLPRYLGDGRLVTWNRLGSRVDELERVHERLVGRGSDAG